MALEDAIIGAIADLTSIAINVFAKKLGFPEVKVKQVEANIAWFILLSLVSALCFVTFKYG